MTARTTTRLAEEAALLSSRADVLSVGAVQSAGAAEVSLVESLMASSDVDLLALHQHAAEVLRLAEAVIVAASGEVARRSESGLPDALARRLGEKNATELLAKRSRLAPVDVATHCRVGLAVTPREGLTGEVLPPFFPVLASALADGALTARAGRDIVVALEKIEPNATAEGLAWAERYLVEGAAKHWEAVTLRDVCRVLPEQFDPDGVEHREKVIRAQRGVTGIALESGGFRYIVDTDAEGSAYWEAAIDARIAPRRQVRFHDVDESATPVDGDSDALGIEDAPEWDSRTWKQKRHDALIDLLRDSLKHDDGSFGGVDTTVVLHVTDQTVASGIGTAYFEGVDGVVSAATARRAMQCANIIAVVLDGVEQPLRLGSTERFFTPGQRRAMAARDGGCVWPGCTAPPRWCDAAHIEPWSATKCTDIENGVLLCHFHHRRFDEDGWQLERRDNVPWFIPPSHIDSSRTPRRGGRVRVPAAP
ncbi:HNH endonuclease signature motif containing protein [Herbiconiux sp. L3-i23]|uniref:HNH endonuclease signature motif containing protein n=1 Tax=Herbiconiux sp. L3-i23 TaxID=2905871 RepID=UPI002072BECF|nr:HNH endonuclease signature motif containing protein [Herbiconiux sp. L3-i23]